MVEIIILVLGSVINAAFLWAGMRMLAVYLGARGSLCQFKYLILTSFVVALFAMIPGAIGWISSIVALIVLLMKFTELSFLQVLLMVVLSRLAIVVASIVLVTFQTLIFGP